MSIAIFPEKSRTFFNFFHELGAVQLGYAIRSKSVYEGHWGAFIYRHNGDGITPQDPQHFFVLHVGSGFMPSLHTLPGVIWPIKLSFPGDKFVAPLKLFDDLFPAVEPLQ